jgi:hypothetical protein
LYIWATQRNLNKEIVYSAHVPESAQKIEGRMPDGIIFGVYSAYAMKYNDAPADYGKVYVYADDEILLEIKKRFSSQKKSEPNLFVIKCDPELKKFKNITPDVQTFADLWNMKDWYAKDFLNALKKILFV